jgi:hypothetical protein
MFPGKGSKTVSQTIKSHIIVRECQGCGKSREYEMVGLGEDEALLVEASEWITIIRESTQPDGQGGYQKMVVHACNPGCATKAATKLFMLPTIEEEVEDKIDLSTLKVN